MRPIDPAIRSHKRPRLGILLRQHERHQVNLTQRAWRHLNINGEPLVFLVVADKVLDGCADAVGLKALDVCRCQMAREVRVFREGFESLRDGQQGPSCAEHGAHPSIHRIALDVTRRRE